jgi:hypothetical protein
MNLFGQSNFADAGSQPQSSNPLLPVFNQTQTPSLFGGGNMQYMDNIKSMTQNNLNNISGIYGGLLAMLGQNQNIGQNSPLMSGFGSQLASPMQSMGVNLNPVQPAFAPVVQGLFEPNNRRKDRRDKSDRNRRR